MGNLIASQCSRLVSTSAGCLEERLIFSFVVDGDPRFALEGYHLARSLAEHCGGFDKVHVHFTPAVKNSTRAVFLKLGCHLHDIEPFGDGKFCNKIVQLENLRQYAFDRVILLDTDMIAVADFRDMVAPSAIHAKIVDLANPSIAALKEIAAAAGMPVWPQEVTTDGLDGPTFSGNCNGGYYAVPRSEIDRLSSQWRRWALWLLEHNEPLKKEGKEDHVDQVSMWLAIHMAALPFEQAPSNVNYYVHFTGPHSYFDPTLPIAVIHYHKSSINALGLIEPKASLSGIEKLAIELANTQIRAGFDNWLFGELRNSHSISE